MLEVSKSMKIKLPEKFWDNFLRILVIIAAGLAATLVLVFIPSKSSTDLPKPAIEASPFPLADQGYKARFSIFINNFKLTFNDQKYFNQLPGAFITNQDPNLIYVKKLGITWGDFFNSLGLKLTSDCLLSDNGDLFCTGGKGTLKFFLNGDRTDGSVLDREIDQNDELVIRYE